MIVRSAQRRIASNARLRSVRRPKNRLGSPPRRRNVSRRRKIARKRPTRSDGNGKRGHARSAKRGRRRPRRRRSGTEKRDSSVRRLRRPRKNASRQSVPRKTVWPRRLRTRRTRRGLPKLRRSDRRRLDETRSRARSAKLPSKRKSLLPSKHSANASRRRKPLLRRLPLTRLLQTVLPLLLDPLSPFPSDLARPRQLQGTALSFPRPPTLALHLSRPRLSLVLRVPLFDLSRRPLSRSSSSRSRLQVIERPSQLNSTLPASDRAFRAHRLLPSRHLLLLASMDPRPYPLTRPLEATPRSHPHLSTLAQEPRPSVWASRNLRRAACPVPTKHSPLLPRLSVRLPQGTPRATSATHLPMLLDQLLSPLPVRSVDRLRSSMPLRGRQHWDALCRQLSLNRSSARQRSAATTRLSSRLVAPSRTVGISLLRRLPVLVDGRLPRPARFGALPVQPIPRGRRPRRDSPRLAVSVPGLARARPDRPLASAQAVSAAYLVRRGWAPRFRVSRHHSSRSRNNTAWATRCILSRRIISNTTRRGAMAALLRAIVLAEQTEARRRSRPLPAQPCTLAGRS